MSWLGNRLREKLNDQETLVGCSLSFSDPSEVEYFGIAGFDWVLIDGEHEGVTTHSVYGLLQAAEGTGIATVVRAPSSDPSNLMAFADAGADAVLVPHVTTAEQAEQIVSSLRYPPRGIRGASATSRAAGYGLISSPVEYFADPTRHTLVGVLLEDTDAYDNLADISGVDGVDFVCLGAGDLAGSLGVPGQKDNGAVTALIDQGIEVFMRAKVPISVGVEDRDSLEMAIQRGIRLPIIPSTGGLLMAAVRSFLL